MTSSTQGQFRIKTTKNDTFEYKFKYVPVDGIQRAIAKNWSVKREKTDRVKKQNMKISFQ